ncbi:hypothetical protein EYZ11_008683 [Aspergillus tanneri]|uniref:Uncharacterized protein n=1 Tax=Aspergillus tanneri TaxID=1220188 RepID=A0A4S3JFC0_9EURO|nr:hypothetical protein EYZ11_008683 [Aspergillus tanneri]
MARYPAQQNRPVHAVPTETNYDTANPAYIRKYLRTYGLTPPRAESYEVQKTRCMPGPIGPEELADR